GEGFVRIQPHRGAIVSDLSPSEIEELFELRAILEPRLLNRSAPRLADEDFGKIDRILAEYSAEMKSMNHGRWGELNTRLHLLLYSKADLPRTLTIVMALLQNTDRYTRLQLSLADSGRTLAERQHADLVRLCREGAVDAACSLLGDHIRHAETALVQFLTARADKAGTDRGEGA